MLFVMGPDIPMENTEIKSQHISSIMHFLLVASFTNMD